MCYQHCHNKSEHVLFFSNDQRNKAEVARQKAEEIVSKIQTVQYSAPNDPINGAAVSDTQVGSFFLTRLYMLAMFL